MIGFEGKFLRFWMISGLCFVTGEDFIQRRGGCGAVECRVILCK